MISKAGAPLQRAEWLQLRAIRQLLGQRRVAVVVSLALTGLAAATAVLSTSTSPVSSWGA